MKLLVVSQYFWPESFIINDVVCSLVAQGHDVVIATGKPNYPDGNVFPGYRAGGVRREYFAGKIEVIRVPLRPRGTGGAFNLVLNYLSFVVWGLLCFPWLLRGKRFDTILVFGLSPITQVIPAIPLKWLKRAHLVVWIQDLWPESLSATGFVSNRFILRAMGWLVRGIYGCTDTLLVQSAAFREPVARYARADKIVYFPNSYPNATCTGSTKTNLPAHLVSLLAENFCIVFAGNLGTAQSVETLVGAAAQLAKLPGCKLCKLVLVGSGSMFDWLEAEKTQRGLDNLILAGRLPRSDMPDLFGRAAGLLVTLKRKAIFSFTIPSKVQAYLASGRPVIAALDGEGARIIEAAGAGLTCPAEDAEQLVRCIERLFSMSPAERDRLGRSGRAYFLEHFELERQAQRLVEILADRIKKHKGLFT